MRFVVNEINGRCVRFSPSSCRSAGDRPLGEFGFASSSKGYPCAETSIKECTLAEYSHRASVTVPAPVHQVFELFSHFNDYPKFMSHIREVTYYDDERSHWVAEIAGRHEWDAVNEGWEQDKTIGWRSTKGLKNSGAVSFTPAGEGLTLVTAVLVYDPPAAALGDLGEVLGAGKSLEKALQRDLDNFVQMVREAPPGALDPTSSSYLFHRDSAAARGKTTKAQDRTMREEERTAAPGLLDENDVRDPDDKLVMPRSTQDM